VRDVFCLCVCRLTADVSHWMVACERLLGAGTGAAEEEVRRACPFVVRSLRVMHSASMPHQAIHRV
jgi:hypothetical protein